MRILVIGDAMIDEYVYGEVNRMSPEDETVPVVDMLSQTSDTRFGGCLNVALNVRSLGGSVSVSSIMPHGHLSLHSSSFDAGDYSTVGSVLLKQRVVNVKTGKQIARLDWTKKYSEEEIVTYKNYVAERTFLNKFDAVIVSDYGKGVVDEYWAQRLSHFDRPVFVDTKNPNLALWSKVPQVYFKLNQKEFFVSGYNTPHPLIVTCGAQGAYMLQGGEQKVLVKGTPVTDPDPVGAGDVFVAALAVKFLETEDIEKAMKFANKAAAISCTRRGTVSVWRDELNQEDHWESLEDRHG